VKTSIFSLAHYSLARSILMLPGWSYIVHSRRTEQRHALLKECDSPRRKTTAFVHQKQCSTDLHMLVSFYSVFSLSDGIIISSGASVSTHSALRVSGFK
jgi:hypothetical protein